jgi:peptidoglycan hydrolase CwlO-like protein
MDMQNIETQLEALKAQVEAVSKKNRREQGRYGCLQW